MQRAKTSSNIPLPKHKRSSSNESLRNSQTRPGLKRSNSFSHLAVPVTYHSRQNIRTTDVNRDYGGSNSNLASASKLPSSYKKSATPLRTGLGSTSSSRKLTVTPLHGVQRSLSPAQHLTSQKINDKKFSSSQFRKTCNFLECRLDDFDPKLLKTLTLATFVKVVTLLFNEIDPRIKISMENYKETVFKYMKLYKYPGPVSISMLKSANTSMSWPPIMAIFGWLVDLINQSNGEEFENHKLRKYMALKSMGTFKGIDTKNLYVNYIDEILGLDRDEYDNLSSECEKLAEERDQKKKIVETLQSKEKNLTDELQRMNSEIKEFKEGNLETKLKNEINQLKAERKKRELKSEETKTSLIKTREIISNQKYSLKDKQELEKKIEDLHYSLEMKEDKLESIKKLKDEYDYKQTNFRRQMEAEINEINNGLIQLHLLNPHTREIKLPDRGFYTEEFLKTVEEKRQLLQNFKEKVELELATAQESLQVHETELEFVSNGVSEGKKEIALLEAELESLNVESERVLFEGDITKQQLEKKIAALVEATPDVESLKDKKYELHKKLLRLDDELEQLSRRSIELFNKLREDAVAMGAEMNKIMEDIYEKSYQACQHRVQEMEGALDALNNALSREDDKEIK